MKDADPVPDRVHQSSSWHGVAWRVAWRGVARGAWRVAWRGAWRMAWRGVARGAMRMVRSTLAGAGVPRTIRAALSGGGAGTHLEERGSPMPASTTIDHIT